MYVVEKGGKLVPAATASEYLNFLRHEQLREFLGLYAILKAKRKLFYVKFTFFSNIV